MSNPSLSVIVPVHNAESTLEQCLNSILDQSFDDFELICIDDGSTDASATIARQFSQLDERVKTASQKQAGGGAARNAGIERANGSCLLFLDADDFFEPTLFEKAVSALFDRNADIAIWKSASYDNETSYESETGWTFKQENIPDSQVFSARDMSSKIFNTFSNVPWNKLFRRSFVEANNLRFQEISRTNDLLFVCSALVLAERITTIPQILTHYRVGTTSNCQATNSKDPLSFWKAFSSLQRFLEERDLWQQFEQSYVNHLVDGVVANIESQTTLEGFKTLQDALRNAIDPSCNVSQHKDSFFYDKWTVDYYRDALKLPTDQFLFSQAKRLQRERESYRLRLDIFQEEHENAMRAMAQQVENIRSSRSFRLGSALLAPLRLVRNTSSNHKR